MSPRFGGIPNMPHDPVIASALPLLNPVTGLAILQAVVRIDPCK